MMFAELLETPAQKFHIRLSPHQALMNDRVDEFPGRGQFVLFDQIGPELQ